MATALSTSEKGNLENYTLIWLDKAVNDDRENIHAQARFRETIHHLKLIQKADECVKYIHSLSKDDRVILIVSGRLGQEVVPDVHSLPQLCVVYVYCMNKEKNEPLAKKFPKIKRIITDLSDLVKKVHEDHIERQRTGVYDPFPLHILQRDTAITQTNDSFLYIHVLIKCLLETNSTTTDKNELLAICRKHYAGNDVELKIIEEFEQNCFPSRALWWYTRPAFLSRILNRALQMQDMNILLRLSFFLRDMQRQLEKNTCKSKVRVFCARLMTHDEIQLLKDNQNGCIIVNTFLSTTTTKEQCKTFFSQTALPMEFERVFFEIEADPHLANTKPFSEIKSMSYYTNEERILFMLGSIFRLGPIQQGSDGVWTVRMKFCSENEPDIKSFFDQHQIDDSLSFGRIFCELKQFEVAEVYYQRLLDDLPAERADTAVVYDALGNLELEKGSYACSVDYFTKALDIRKNIPQTDEQGIADSHFNLGKAYGKKNNIKQALDALNKAMDIYSKKLKGDHQQIAACCEALGDVYMTDKKYSKALEYYEKVLPIRKKHFADNHPLMADSFRNIAHAHLALKHFDQALDYFNRALQIYKRSPSPPQFVIGMVLKHVASVHEQNKKFKEAQTNYEEALTYFERILPPNHNHIIETRKDIQRMIAKSK